MRSSLLRQFPEEIQKKITDNTIESYELRDAILEGIDNDPMFIIRAYLKTDDLKDILEEKDMEYIKNRLKSVITYEWMYFKFKKSKRRYGYIYTGCSRKLCTHSII